MLAKLKTLREEREDGFTLIELLVVILIIGILSAIAIPVFLNQRKTANDSAVQSDVKNAVSQVETWLVSNNNTPALPAATAFDIKVSDGVTVRISKYPVGGTTTVTSPVSNGYTVCGFHSNGKKFSGEAAASALVYKSADGGMQKDPGACPGGTGILEYKLPA